MIQNIFVQEEPISPVRRARWPEAEPKADLLAVPAGEWVRANKNTASGHVTPYSPLIGQVRVGEVLQQLLVNLKESGHPKNTNVQQRRKFSKNQNIFDFL